MGILMGLARWIVRTLFVLSIAILLIISTGAHFSDKENLSPIAKELAVSQMSDEQLIDMSNSLKSICQSSSKEKISQFMPEINETISINCSKVSKEYAKEIFKEQIVDAMLENVYSQKCDGINCFFTNPLNAASESAHNFLKTLEIIAFAAVLILAGLLVLITPGISGRLFAIGSPVFFAGMPYLFTGSIKSQVISSMPQESAEMGGKIAELVFNYLSGLFLILLIIGGILIATGFIIKFTIEKRKKK